MSEKDIKKEAEDREENDLENGASELNDESSECTDQTEKEIDNDDSKISELEKENAELRDRYLRTAAEYDNFRKRTAKEKLEIYSDATIESVKQILSVVDNFERAMEADSKDENFKNGMMMIFNQYKDVLKKLGVEEIEAMNKPFDPDFHNAVNQIEDENFESNTVCQVFQKGYKLNDKVIRHAMVVVANP